MHFVYVDDSKDQSANVCVFSALLVPAANWREAFATLKVFRQELKRTHGIYVRKEFHATEFVRGKGHIAEKPVFKNERCKIFRRLLEVLADMPHLKIINVALPLCRESWAFERLLNRVNRSMAQQQSHAILICDEGKEQAYTKMARRMSVYNPIPSAYGQWGEGQPRQNITIDRVIEDPIFKSSATSWFIQAADFCAYALLRREVPTEHASKYNLHTAFQVLTPVLELNAHRADPDGIVRP
jgi:hypothetical protein